MRINSSIHRGKLFQTRIIAVLLLFLSLLSIQNIFAKDTIRVADFSSSSPDLLLPEHWEPHTFGKISKKTQYTIFNDNNIYVVKAVSEQSASALIRKITIDPLQYPVIKWRWKISDIYKNGDVAQKAGDDYPARMYITFDFDHKNAGLFERIKFTAAKFIFGEDTPYAAINYIWESNAPVETLVANPYTDRLQMFVIQSGAEKLNTWIEEERNIYLDYIRAFGRTPPLITGIAIMTDSDDTGEKAISYYGDIIMKAADNE